ncbi:MAG: energy transducer TonB [Terracidiphilus sp.]|jgi:TonB family protein
MIRSRSKCLCWPAKFAVALAVTLWITPEAYTQGQTPAGVAALPSDPKSLLILAAKLNGLSGEDVMPWHMRISFTVFDESGKKPEQGTFEEYWLGKNKYKISYTSAGYTQSAYATGDGVLLTGARDPVQEPLAGMARRFISPIFLDPGTIENSTIDRQKREIDKVKLVCLTERGHRPEPPHLEFMGPTYCLENDSVALRFVGEPWSRSPEDLRNNTVQFQGHYLPGDLEVKQGSKRVLTAHLEQVDLLPANDEADIAPPKDARLPPQVVTVSESEARKLLIQSSKPVYPPIAQAARVSGAVVLQVTVGTDGRVVSVHVISGPAMLQQAALDGVRKWTFKPMFWNGESVQISTTITVPFTLI